MVCGSVIFLFVGSWARNIIDVIKISFGLSIFGPLHSSPHTVTRFDVFQQKMESLSLFLVQFQAVSHLTIFIKTLKFINTFLMNISI